MRKGDYSKYTHANGKITILYWDGRIGTEGGTNTRTFDDRAHFDLWWRINGVPKFGLRRRLSPMLVQWEALKNALPKDQAEQIQASYLSFMAGATDEEEAMLQAVTTYADAEATETEPAMPVVVPIAVPENAKELLEKFINELNDRAEAKAEAEAAERKAGWDPRP